MFACVTAVSHETVAKQTRQGLQQVSGEERRAQNGNVSRREMGRPQAFYHPRNRAKTGESHFTSQNERNNGAAQQVGPL